MHLIIGEPGAYPAVSGGAGGAENRNAPNGTAALSFVANSEAARYVFVVVVVHDAMITGWFLPVMSQKRHIVTVVLA